MEGMPPGRLRAIYFVWKCGVLGASEEWRPVGTMDSGIVRRAASSVRHPPNKKSPTARPSTTTINTSAMGGTTTAAPGGVFIYSPCQPASGARRYEGSRLVTGVGHTGATYEVLAALKFLPLTPRLCFARFLGSRSTRRHGANVGLKVH